MNNGQSSGFRYRVEQRQLDRPVGVILVACFQLLKAGVLLLTGILLRWKPEFVDSSQSILYPLLYVATRGNYAAIKTAMQGANLLPGLIFLLGFYLAVIGFGLWELKQWARRTVMFTCGLTLLLSIKSILWPGTFGSIFPITSASDLQYVHIPLFFDAVVFLYLCRGKTAEFFKARAQKAKAPPTNRLAYARPSCPPLIYHRQR